MRSGEIDTWTVERHGIKFRVSVHEDYDTKPSDFDCYDETAKQAWRNDQWQFVCISVTPVIDGVDGEYIAEAIGGFEWGSYRYVSQEGAEVTTELDRDYANAQYVPEILDSVIGNLGKLQGKLQESLAVVTAAIDSDASPSKSKSE